MASRCALIAAVAAISALACGRDKADSHSNASGGTSVGASEGGTIGGGGQEDASGGSAGGGGASGEAGSTMTGDADVVSSFQNGVFWNDVAGNRIEAHGGGFMKMGGVFYWVGENRSRNGFNGMNLYRSPDLAHWELVKAIVTPATAPELATAGRIVERPKLLYNDVTQTFVLWLHFDGNGYTDAEAGVFSSATIDGDYAFHQAFRPNGNMSRDDTLFKDDDGSAYFISAANDNADLVIYQLTADYLDIARQVVTLWPGAFREAPAMFKTKDGYFLLSSGATGWTPNQAKYGTATSIDGPWSALQNIGDTIAFDTQSTYVIPVVGTETTTFIYASDRWMAPNLVNSKYIWLPLVSSGFNLTLSYAASWRLDLTTGRVTIP